MPNALREVERYEVWALLFLSSTSEQILRALFIDDCCISSRFVCKRLHATIYHARRELMGLGDTESEICVRIPGSELRLMVMAPGGENPRPELVPSKRSIGVRIRRAGGATNEIDALRAQFFKHETPEVLGRRAPSTRRRNAFGARHFQPHIKVLRPGSSIDRELTRTGALLRSTVSEIVFDKLVVRCRRGKD